MTRNGGASKRGPAWRRAPPLKPAPSRADGCVTSWRCGPCRPLRVGTT
jgi:hypothetical protein